MRFGYILKLSAKSFMQRKLRSWLTILGIVIGVAAVVTILSLGESMQQSVESRLGGLGADIITVSPGFSRASMRGFGGRPGEASSNNQQNITNRDIQIIKSISGVRYVNGVASGRAEVTYLSESVSLTVEGVDPLAWKEITTSELASGRYFTQNDVNVVILGNSVAEEMFKEPLSLNSQINVEGVSFKIVGILEESGGFGGGGGDRTIFMPYDSAVNILEDMDTNRYNSLQVKVSDEELVEPVMEDIESKLMLSRHVTEKTKDFTVSSSLQMQETISDVTSTISLFLAGIAAVSLLVGAIGIANTMFMSVMERTKQIGILKALGTTNFEIIKLFLTESAIIGFAGGFVGIFLAFILIGIVSEMGFSLAMGGMGRGTIATITPELILFALGFSTAIGIISGLIPARMASKLQPTEALRYE